MDILKAFIKSGALTVLICVLFCFIIMVVFTVKLQKETYTCHQQYYREIYGREVIDERKERHLEDLDDADTLGDYIAIWLRL
jgi:hypothetical protein